MADKIMLVKLILVRHGETDYNASNTIQGWLPSKLTEKGKKQAFELGRNLTKEGIEMIYCSDLLRTRETAKEILKSIKAPIKYVHWLRERNIGEFQGMPRGTFLKLAKEKNLDLLNYQPKGGESINEFRKMIKNNFDKFIKKNKQKEYSTVLFITHGGCIAQIVMHLSKNETYFESENCGVISLPIE